MTSLWYTYNTGLTQMNVDLYCWCNAKQELIEKVNKHKNQSSWPLEGDYTTNKLLCCIETWQIFYNVEVKSLCAPGGGCREGEEGELKKREVTLTVMSACVWETYFVADSSFTRTRTLSFLWNHFPLYCSLPSTNLTEWWFLSCLISAVKVSKTVAKSSRESLHTCNAPACYSSVIEIYVMHNFSKQLKKKSTFIWKMS